MNQEVDWATLIEKLAEPFAASDIFWRAGSKSGDKKRAMALPYADPRVYEDRLNTVCPGDWSVQFRPWGETRLICELTIHGSSRSSTGEFDQTEKRAFAQGTVAEAQAFKRACVKFGLGRYLYDIPASWVSYDNAKGQLLETPSLPKKFLPAAKTAPREPQLTPERAEAMAAELVKLGFEPREQVKLAASAVGRPVRALTQLSEAQALEVWATAKRLSPEHMESKPLSQSAA